MIALMYAALCMERQSGHIRSATKRLGEELDRQILPDGGHISRNPGALIELLIDLLPLRQAFTSRNIQPPPALLNAIDRMMPMLRFFRHGDGNFALFNGMGPTQTDLVTTVLAYDDARGTPVANAPHSGYQRLEAAGTVVLMDTGRPPPLAVSQEAHAGCLSFELSVKFYRLVVNCGMPATSRESWRQMARSTAAHSTVTFNDESSARFVDLGRGQAHAAGHADPGRPAQGQGRARRAGRRDRTARRARRLCRQLQRRPPAHADACGRRPAARRRGCLHPDQGRRDARRQGRIRAALPSAPSVKANRLTDSHGAMLMLPNKEVWTFSAFEDRIDLEESVYLAGTDGPRRTLQIVIHGRARKVQRDAMVVRADRGVAAFGRAPRARGGAAVVVRRQRPFPRPHFREGP